MPSPITEGLLDTLADSLVHTGYAILPELFDRDWVTQLRAEFDRAGGQFKAAGIGRKEDFTVQTSVRGDRICWLEGHSRGPAHFLQAMETVREGLNQRLFLGLFDYESHLAFYPIGAFYKKHVDAFKGRSNRVLSTVLYLNEYWAEADGGELVLYDQADEIALERLAPHGGTLVVFLSERFPHEVLRAARERYSIAGWFRINANTSLQVDPPA